jgi:hypothetical protein
MSKEPMGIFIGFDPRETAADNLLSRPINCHANC